MQVAPWGLVNNPNINNIITLNQYSPFQQVAYAPIRNLGYSNFDTNHTRLLSVYDNSIPFSPLSNILPGQINAAPDPLNFNAENVPGTVSGNEPSPVVSDSGIYAWYNSGTYYPNACFPLTNSGTTTYNMNVNAKAASGTTIFFTVTHVSYTGTSETLYSAALGGFSSSAYTNVSQALTLGNPPQYGDTVCVSWTSNSAYIANIKLTPTN